MKSQVVTAFTCVPLVRALLEDEVVWLDEIAIEYQEETNKVVTHE